MDYRQLLAECQAEDFTEPLCFTTVAHRSAVQALRQPGAAR